MTGEVFRLHLNGGPRDDEYVEHWASSLELTALRLRPSYLDPAAEVPLNRGRYVQRLDENGDPVSHDLAGFAEADWQGWR